MPRVVKRSASQAITSGPSRRGVPLPQFVLPQLSQPVEKPPSGPQWLHEIKLDGYRMAARIDNGRVQLLTRTGLDWTSKYPSVIAALSNMNVKTAYVDGELCGVDEAGLPSFAQTQAATDGEREVRLVYVGQHRDLLASACLAGLPAHGGQLRPIAADIGHVMGDDQMLLGIDGDLRIVADNASALPL